MSTASQQQSTFDKTATVRQKKSTFYFANDLSTFDFVASVY